MRSSSVRGFKIHSAEVKLLAYADDVGVSLSVIKSVSQVVSLAKAFCDMSGAVFSREKSCGLFTGCGT